MKDTLVACAAGGPRPLASQVAALDGRAYGLKECGLGDLPLTCTVPPYAPTPLVPLLDAKSSSCKSGKGVVGFDSLATLASWPYGDFNGALSDYWGFLSGVLVCQGLVA